MTGLLDWYRRYHAIKAALILGGVKPHTAAMQAHGALESRLPKSSGVVESATGGKPHE